MRTYRVKLNGWTASFRYPQFVTGMQPTLPLPPPSTVYGLVAAAVGQWVDPQVCRLAYVFKHEGKARDLETIYQFSKSNSAGSNVIFREWLTDWQLWLYFEQSEWANAFIEPVFPLLLGRQQELAHVEGVQPETVVLEEASTTLYGTAVPFPFWSAAGIVMALPLVMSAELPRQAIGVRPWQLIHEPVKLQHEGVWHDPELKHGVYFLGDQNV